MQIKRLKLDQFACVMKIQIFSYYSLFALALHCCLLPFATPARGQSGAAVWTNRYSSPLIAPSVAVDDNGNIFATEGRVATTGYITMKFSSEGSLLWTNIYPDGYDDLFPKIATDKNGNVFIAGASVTNNLDYPDYVTIKYSNSGVPLWTNLYNGTANGDDDVLAIATGRSGNVFVTGRSQSTNGSFDYDYVTIAYSSKGSPLWTNRYSGPDSGSSDDEAEAIAVDSNDNVVVTGYSSGTNGYNEYATVAYSSTGEPLWTNRYALAGADAEGLGIAVNSHDDICVTGRAEYNGFYYGRMVYSTIAYSSAGTPLWTNRFNTSGNLFDDQQGIGVDGYGNVFVTAQAPVQQGTNTVYAYATLAYSGAGEPLWTNIYHGPGIYNGPGIGDDSASALAADSGSNVFVTGTSTGTNGSNDYATIAYSNAGMPLWTNRYNQAPDGNDIANAIAVDASGNVCVIGNDALIKYASLLSNPNIPIQIQALGGQIVLSWTNATFTLQSAPTVEGFYTNIPGVVSPYTNVISGTQRYFRLKQ